MKALFTTCFVVILIISCAKWVRPQISAPGPTLLTDQNSAEAAALDSVTLVRDPIPVVNRNNSATGEPASLFGTNVELMPGRDAAITARARDSRSRNHSLTVEFVGKIPTLDSLTQIVVRLPDIGPSGRDLDKHSSARADQQ